MGLREVLEMVRRSGRAGVVGVLVTLVAAVTGFVDPMSLLITVGGSLGVAWLTFPRERMAAAWHHLRAALGDAPPADPLISTFRRLARAHRLEGPLGLERAIATVDDAFLRQALVLVLEARDGDDVSDVLLGEARGQTGEIEAARHVVLTLGRLFPAFGLIGTLIGLALLLRNLGVDASLAKVAPGLAIAVLTTLYGAVLANVVVLPLATRLQSHLAREVLRQEMIIAGTLLVQRREYPSRVERVLRAYAGAPLGEGVHVRAA